MAAKLKPATFLSEKSNTSHLVCVLGTDVKIFEDVTQNFDLVPLFIQRRHVHRALQDVGQRRRLEVLTVDHDHRLKMEKI